MSKLQRSDPRWSNAKAILIDVDTLRIAEQQIASCEACVPEAEIPFDYVLDFITGANPQFTDYLLPEPAHCPRCKGVVRSGRWRWYTWKKERRVVIRPGTLVTLKDDNFGGTA